MKLHLFQRVVVAGEVGLEADADGRHARRPLAVGHAAVDLLPVEAAQRVAVLAVVPSSGIQVTVITVNQTRLSQ